MTDALLGNLSTLYIFDSDIYINIIGIQPLGRSGQRPELSQATGMALVRCILGKFLGVVCHCFPPKMMSYVKNVFLKKIFVSLKIR